MKISKYLSLHKDSTISNFLLIDESRYKKLSLWFKRAKFFVSLSALKNF